MKVTINGKPMKAKEERKPCSDFAGWCVIILGVLAAYGWWMLWV